MSKAQTVLTAFRSSRDACPKLEGVCAALERVHQGMDSPLDMLFGRGRADEYAALRGKIAAAHAALDALLCDTMLRGLCDTAFAEYADRPVHWQDEFVNARAIHEPMMRDDAGEFQAPVDSIHGVSPDNGRAA